MNDAPADPQEALLSQLLADMLSLRLHVVDGVQERLSHLRDCFPGNCFTPSAVNLAHYLTLRRYDLRPLQERLAQAGLSSLGRGEAHTLATIDRIIDTLARATGTALDLPDSVSPGFSEGVELLETHTAELFGKVSAARRVRIMVTLPSEAAQDYALVLGLVRAGMDCARINCAHDDAEQWERMAVNVRRAAEEAGRGCRILMDLAGHKLRTGPIELAPAVHHLRPKRDPYGCVVAPAQVLLTGVEHCDPARIAPASGYVHLQVEQELHERLQPGDRLYFSDGRGKRRHLDIVARTPAGSWLAHCHNSAYLSSDVLLELRRADGDGKELVLGHYSLCPFPGEPLELRLYWNDRLLLRRDDALGRPARRNDDGEEIEPASIGCTLPQVLDELRVGDTVWIDDGKLGTEVEALWPEGALLRVNRVAPGGMRVSSDKGINFPDTRLNLPPLAEKDLQDLDFVCRHADMVGFSFVETLEDIEFMMAELARRGRAELPIIAKIETERAVNNLPDLILGTIGRHRLGIMIARGDLAVELGSVRMAEIQEEILWLCEAGHVPVIWATQVLETLAKKGMRSRPELTDAAMGVRAECVMLNKGPYVLDAVGVLNSILERMQAHQHKKVSRLRALSLAGRS